MKKFIIKAVIFCVLLIGVDRGLGLGIKCLYNLAITYPIDYNNAYGKLLYNVNDDIVIIGESRATHSYISTMIQDSLKMSCINAGKDGTGFLAQNCIINGMLDRYHPKMILWELDPTALMDVDHTQEMNSMVDFTPFYDRVPDCQKYINERSKYERYKMYSELYRWNGKMVGITDILLNGNKEDDAKGYVPLFKETNKIRKQKYEDDSQQYRISMLRKTIQRSKGLGTQIIIVSAPVYYTSNLDSTKQEKDFSKLLNETETPWLKHTNDFLNGDCAKLFADWDHLNVNGSQKYMQLIIPELKSLVSTK